MSNSKTKEEWETNCQIVIDKCNGEYPPFWFSEIVASGLMKRIEAGWIN